MLIHQKIEEIIHNYSDSRNTIGTFLIDNQHVIKKFSMQEIADETFTSKSTLVRFAKQLGFSGWNEFIDNYKKEILYLENHVDDIDVNIPFSANDTSQQLAGYLSTVSLDAVSETIELLDEDQVNRATCILYKAKRVCVFGVSVNYYLAKLFQHKMVQIGKNIEIINQSEMKFQAFSLSEQDCAIIISYSGNDKNRMPTTLLEILKKHNVPIIAITSLGENLLSESATVVLSIASRERLYSKIGSFSTENSIHFLLNLLYSCYFKLDFDYNLSYKISLSQEVEKNRVSHSHGIREE